MIEIKLNCFTTYFILYIVACESLMCYHCLLGQRNQTQCDENIPQVCSPKQGCGVSHRDSGFTKSCIIGCPTSGRGDGPSAFPPCDICGQDFCNDHLVGRPQYKVEAAATPDTYTHNDTAYTIFTEPRTFWDAWSKCLQRKETLVTIKTKEVQTFLHTQLDGTRLHNEKSLIRGFWIGAVSESGNPWIWKSSGDPILSRNESKCFNSSFQNWLPGQPMERKVKRYFCGVFIFQSGGWKSVSCGERTASFVCQRTKQPGSKENEFMQSIIYRGIVYTYHSRPLRASHAHSECFNIGARIADLQNPDVKIKIENGFSFVNPSHKYWSKRSCQRDNSRNSQGTIYYCLNELPFICQKNFKEFNWSYCAPKKTTTPPPETTQPNLLTPQPIMDQTIPTEPQPVAIQTTTSTLATTTTKVSTTTVNQFCHNLTLTYQGKTLRFLSAEPGDFANSLEICTATSKPLGKIHCQTGSAIYNQSTLTLLHCPESIHNIKLELEKEAAENLNLAGLAQETSSLTAGNLTQNQVNDSIDVLILLDQGLTEIQQKENAASSIPTSNVTAGTLANVVKSIKNLCSTSGDKLRKVANRKIVQLHQIMENFATKVELRRRRLNVSTGIIDLQVVDFGNNGSANEDAHSASFQNQSRISIRRSTGTSRAYFIRYNNATLFPSKQQVGQVISATALDKGLQQVPVHVTFSMRRSNHSQLNNCVTETCSYYRPENQTWLSHGCEKVDDAKSDVITCVCNHTTSFAIVVGVQEMAANVALDIASEVGLAICVFFLLITVVLFFKMPELQRVRSASIHINLCICLAVTYCAFLFGVNQTADRGWCVSIAAFIHFTLLSAWGWMLVESVTMYRMFVFSFDRLALGNIWIMALLVYLSSIVIVVITLLVSMAAGNGTYNVGCGEPSDAWSNYVGVRYCWLTGYPLYSFVAIIGLILLVNIWLAFLVIKAITWGRKRVNSSVDESSAIHVLRAVLVAILMGLSWIFAIPIVISTNPTVQLVFGWFFAVSTSVQGLFVFYFFCLRRSDVRAAWTYPIFRAITCGSGRLRHPAEATSKGSVKASRKSESTEMTSPSSKSWRRFTNSGRGSKTVA